MNVAAAACSRISNKDWADTQGVSGVRNGADWAATLSVSDSLKNSVVCPGSPRLCLRRRRWQGHLWPAVPTNLSLLISQFSRPGGCGPADWCDLSAGAAVISQPVGWRRRTDRGPSARRRRRRRLARLSVRRLAARRPAIFARRPAVGDRPPLSRPISVSVWARA